jgi:excisionase family DNA binding protein
MTTERLPIKEAAERLGVSADTVRRRMKKGELVGEKESTPQGYEWRILLPVRPGTRTAGEGAVPQDAPGATEEPPQGSGDLREKGAVRWLWHWLRGGSKA